MPQGFGHFSMDSQMKISRFIDAKSFCRDASELKVKEYPVDLHTLERLEEQRSLLPRLRLHYADEIERRWWADAHPGSSVGGALEPDGPRWDAACALEAARGPDKRSVVDPTVTPHPLDAPEERFLQFIEVPANVPFVTWRDYRVDVNAKGQDPIYRYDTVITYYSSWQLLQFAEVVNMGVISLMNLIEHHGWPADAAIAAAPKSKSAQPNDAMRGFEEHSEALDAIVWFAEEARNGYVWAVRKGGYGARRALTDTEWTEVMRTRTWAAEQAPKLHGVGPEQLRAAIRFLCARWARWAGEGRPLVADAYKSVAAHGVQLGCLATGKSASGYSIDIGLVGGYRKPIIDVMWPDWAAEQRTKIRLALISLSHPSSSLKADFSVDLVDRFLDFIEDKELHGFYWRMDSFHRHAFNGSEYALEGLRGDVQGMAVVLEHIAEALGAKRPQLYEKFKELWQGEAEVQELLKNNKIRKIAHDRAIDLDWFEKNNRLGYAEQTAADLVIAHAIRGGVHRAINETNPLQLERMLLIMLRAALKTFEAVNKGDCSYNSA